MTDILNRTAKPWHTATTETDPVAAELARIRRQRDDQARTIDRLRAEVETAEIAHRRHPGEGVKDPEGSFLIFRRTMVRHYLVAREAAEADPGPITEARYGMARELLGLVYTAEGGNGVLSEVLAQVDALGFLIAEQWVEIWAHREGFLDDLTTGEIVSIAQDVRGLAAVGVRLDDMGMADLVEPYLPGGAA